MDLPSQVSGRRISRSVRAASHIATATCTSENGAKTWRAAWAFITTKAVQLTAANGRRICKEASASKPGSRARDTKALSEVARRMAQAATIGLTALSTRAHGEIMSLAALAFIWRAMA